MTDASEEATAGDLPPSHWWLPVGAIVVVYLLQGVAVALLPPDPVSQLPIVGPLVAIGLALQILSPLAVHWDRRYVRAVSAWDPSQAYYLMVLPPFAIVLAPLYLIQRHRYVGVP